MGSASHLLTLQLDSALIGEASPIPTDSTLDSASILRVKARARPGDMASFEEFISAEHAQLSSSNPAGPQLLRCREMAEGMLSSYSVIDCC